LFGDEAEACAHTKCHAWALSALPTVAHQAPNSMAG
jgi:hypothetical protein